MSQYFFNKKIIVTGGAGFIGSSLVKKIVELGGNVLVIDNLWRGKIENLKDINGNYVIDIKNQFINADLTEYQQCLKYIKGCDIIYHLADIVAGVDFVFANESFVFRKNILINSNIINACVVNGIENYVYVGTACSFPKHLQMASGIVQLKEDQTYPAEPESSYGWSKLMGEYEALLIAKEKLLNVGILRLHNVYGPGVDFDLERSQVLPSLVRKAINYPNEDFIVWGSGDQYRDFVYIDDVIEALLLVVQKGLGMGVIQIGAEKAISIREAAETIVAISKKRIQIIYDLEGPQGDRGRIASCEKARRILDWSAKTSFQEGLLKLFLWVETQINNKTENGAF